MFSSERVKRKIQSTHSDGRATTALVPFSGDDLVVEATHVQTELLPRVEVVRSRDRAARAVRLADGPVLVEGSGALDRRLVDTRRLVDVVGRAGGGDGALEGETRAGVVGTEVLEDVVLDERVRGPAVDGQVGVTCGDVVGGV